MGSRRKRREGQKESVYSLTSLKPSKPAHISELGPLTIIPPGKRVSPLSPNFISETSLAVSPRFNWRVLEQQVRGQVSGMRHLVSGVRYGV